MEIERQNGKYIVDKKFTVQLVAGKYVCNCGTANCDHITEVTNTFAKNKTTAGHIGASPAGNASVLFKNPSQPANPGDFTAEDIQSLVAIGTIPENTPIPVLRLFSKYCSETLLSPFKKQACLLRRRQRDGQVKFTIVTQIDGYRAIAARSGQHVGTDDALFIFDERGLPVKCTITVYKMVSGIKCAFTASCYFSEYYPSSDAAFMWNKMPANQLEKCTEAKALRRAWSQDLAGIYVAEELDGAADLEDIRDAKGSGNDVPSQKTVVTENSPGKDPSNETVPDESTKKTDGSAVTPPGETTSVNEESECQSLTNDGVQPPIIADAPKDTQVSAIQAMCSSLGLDPEAWTRERFGYALNSGEFTAQMAGEAIRLLNEMRKGISGKK